MSNPHTPSCNSPIQPTYYTESIDTATAAAQKLGLTNIEFRQCDVTTNLSEIPTSSFDIAHSHQVMIHLPNPPQVMTEIRRILKPQGGILAIRDNHSFYTHPNDPAVARNWEIYKIFSRRRGAHPDAGFVNHVWMHEAGFEWKDIEYGSAAWEPAGLDKGVWAEDQKKSFLPVYGVSVEEEDGEFMRDLAEGWDKWRDDPHSRFVGVDGWVIGVKNEE